MQRMPNNALEVEGLTKSFGDFRAVDQIGFAVPRGSVIGLLGPNGAGKTTTIQMLMGTIELTSGSIRYFGEDFAHNRLACLQRINYTSAYNELLGAISVRENLAVFANLYGLKNPRRKISQLVELFEIGDFLNKTFSHLSAGQRTRVSIAKALLNDPELVMMDEPTASLDPDIADKVISMIETARHERRLSILFTSHNMSEVARICDEVILLDHGKIIRMATPRTLASEIRHPVVSFHFDGPPAVVTRHLHSLGTEATLNTDKHVTVEVENHRLSSVIGSLDRLPGITVTDVDIRKPDLEEAFVHFSRRQRPNAISDYCEGEV